MSPAASNRLFLAAFAVLVLAIGYFGPFQSIESRRAQVQQQIATLNEDIAREQQQAIAARNASNRRESALDDLRHQGVLANRSDAVSAFEVAVAKLAARNHVTLGTQAYKKTGQTAGDPQTVGAAARVVAAQAGAGAPSAVQAAATAADPTFDSVGVDIEVFGRTENAVDFVRGLEHMPLVVGVTKLEVTPTNTFSNGRVTVKAALSLNVYYLEAARIGLAR